MRLSIERNFICAPCHTVMISAIILSLGSNKFSHHVICNRCCPHITVYHLIDFPMI